MTTKITLHGISFERLKAIDTWGNIYDSRPLEEDILLTTGVVLKQGAKITTLTWEPASMKVDLETGHCTDGYNVTLSFIGGG